jgi:hypothetical protein
MTTLRFSWLFPGCTADMAGIILNQIQDLHDFSALMQVNLQLPYLVRLSDNLFVVTGSETHVKLTLKIEKKGAVLYENVHDISDADSFGVACAAAWREMFERRFKRATSVGELMEEINSPLIEELCGATISLVKP